MARKKKNEEKIPAETPEKTQKSEPVPSKTTDTESAQPELNIGMIGHVDHGKTTLVQTLSGKWTDTHSEEIKRGITIRLGYADVNFYKCESCPEPDAYSVRPTCQKCGKPAKHIRKISLVDAPGHESLMATMLCGSAIMDGAILLVSAAETCPQPQTREHLQALEIVGIENLIVIQNKIDLVKEDQAKKNYDEIKAFLKGSAFENAPIIPLSAFHKINIDLLVQTIQEQFKTPKRDLDAKPRMFVARSFDINKPGTTPEKLIGGILGGSIRQGTFKSGDEISIVPGYEKLEKNQKVWKPLNTKIISIMTGGKNTETAVPGGSIALLTELDPSVVKSDKLVGSMVVRPGEAPPVWYELKLETHLLERVVGAKDKLVVDPVKLGELLMLNVNSAATVGAVKELGKNTIKCQLRKPVCADPGARVAMSRNVGQRWRLIGYGIIKQ
ncbi:MAG: translation initiation factor IF-2 subunit gamma [Candidatus Auribacter fodinae]|uniref:protein-synthesizing GTPase n=1 Tax=Candidatus Auribacter fodinae TaxID=2093366 RepID=A0A3A4QWW9_9BACT|nr:MAG: translation initiation factor IF-2 subunit gamma [Candidatus Auribacter fodinae]